MDLFVIFALCLSFPYCLVCFLQPCGSLVCYVFLCFVSFPYGVLGQVWYLIV